MAYAGAASASTSTDTYVSWSYTSSSSTVTGSLFRDLLAIACEGERPHYNRFQMPPRTALPVFPLVEKFHRQFTGSRFPIGGSKK